MSIVNGEEVEHGPQKYYEREDDDDGADDLVDENDAIILEDVLYFVDEPCESEPPQQSSCDDAEVSDAHFERVAWYDESQLCKNGHEQQYDKWVGERDEEGRETIVEIGALRGAAVVHVARGIGAETDNSEDEQHDAAQNLQEELVSCVVDEVHDETHAKSGDEGVEQVAGRGAQSCNEAVPPAFVERPLYAQNAHRPHGRRCQDTYDEALENGV